MDAEAYGPIFSLRQGLTTAIAIGRVQAAVDAMERRAQHWLVGSPASRLAGPYAAACESS
ncbi:hypothetical protein BD779DRAFT_1565855 [Infundibulicybe gibba]|nr:hypothetical protein BD779DRAFT_1565855 [Infundibulicybe gibba]